MGSYEYKINNLKNIIEKLERSNGKTFLGKYVNYNDKEYLIESVDRILKKRGCKYRVDEHLTIVLFMVWHFKYDMHDDIKKYCEDEYGFANIKLYEESLLFLRDNFNSFLVKTDKMYQYVETLKTHAIVYSTGIDEFIESIFKIYFYRFSERLNEIDVEKFVESINSDQGRHKYTELMQSGKKCFLHSLEINKNEVKKFIYAILEQIDAVWYEDYIFKSEYLEQFYIERIEMVVNNSNILDRKQSENIKLGNRNYIRKRKVELFENKRLKVIFPEKIITKEDLNDLSMDESAKICYRLFSAKGDVLSNVNDLNSKKEHMHFEKVADVKRLKINTFCLIFENLYDDTKLDILIDGMKYHTVELNDLIPDNKLIMFDEGGQRITKISDAETVIGHNTKIFNYADAHYEIGDFNIYHLKGRRLNNIEWDGNVYNDFLINDVGISGNNMLKDVTVRYSQKMYNNVYAQSISISSKYQFEDTRFRVGKKNSLPSIRKYDIEYDGKKEYLHFFRYYPKSNFEVVEQIAVREAGNKINKDGSMKDIVIFNDFEFKFRNSTYFKFKQNNDKEDESLLEYLNVNGRDLMDSVEERGNYIKFKYSDKNYEDVMVFLKIPYVKVEIDDREVYETQQCIFFEGLKKVYAKQELNIYQNNRKLDVTYNKTKMKYQYSLLKPNGKEILWIEQGNEKYLIGNIYDEMHFEFKVDENKVEEEIIKIDVINSSGTCNAIIKEFNEKNEILREEVYAIPNNVIKAIEFEKGNGTHIKMFKESKSRFSQQVKELEMYHYSKHDEFVSKDVLKFKIIETERGVKKFGEQDFTLDINANLKTKTNNAIEIYSFYIVGNQKRNHSNCPFKLVLTDKDNLIFEILDRDDEPVEVCTRTKKINPASGGDRTISKVKGIL